MPLHSREASQPSGSLWIEKLPFDRSATGVMRKDMVSLRIYVASDGAGGWLGSTKEVASKLLTSAEWMIW